MFVSLDTVQASCQMLQAADENFCAMSVVVKVLITKRDVSLAILMNRRVR